MKFQKLLLHYQIEVLMVIHMESAVQVGPKIGMYILVQLLLFALVKEEVVFIKLIVSLHQFQTCPSLRQALKTS